jgi:hypothetical protein
LENIDKPGTLFVFPTDAAWPKFHANKDEIYYLINSIEEIGNKKIVTAKDYLEHKLEEN